MTLMCGTTFQANGDEAKDIQKDPQNNLPNVVSNWAPAFDKGYITLYLTNNTDHLLRVSTAIHPRFLFDPSAPITIPKDSARDEIEALVVFSLGPKVNIAGHAVSGGTDSVQIAPGETKAVKLITMDDSLISTAQSADKVICTLILSGEELAKTRVVMTKMADVWKVEK